MTHRKRRHPFRRGIFQLAIVGCFLFPRAMFAQEQEETGNQVVIPSTGTELFRNEFFRAGIRPLRNLKDVLDVPEQTIIVLLGENSVKHSLYNADIRRAVERGAAILIASDRTIWLADLFGVQITGGELTAAPEDSHRGKIHRPFVRPYKFWGEIDENSPRAPFKSLEAAGQGALATNYTSVLRILPQRTRAHVEALAGYPFSSSLIFNQFDPNRDHFAAGGTLEEGRFLILADHSVFVNGMVWCDDNANFWFARDCVKWLAGKEEKNRCLFVEDGNIQTEFELVFPDTDDSLLNQILKAIPLFEKHGNTLIHEAEKQNLFNQIILQSVGQRPIIRGVLLAFTAFVILACLLMFVRNRAGADPARTLVTPELAAMIPRGNVLQQRFTSLIESENVYEAARHLVRDFLSGMNAEPDEKGLPPKLEIEDGYIDEAGLRRRIARLWRIGFDSVPVAVALDDWPKLTRDLKEVLTDADDGWWKFV
jgi:hypothetical protein